MRRIATLILTAALAASGLIAAAGAASAAPAGTEISIASTPFGTALVVGSGTYKGYSLYDITSDNSPSSFGCTTTLLTLGGHTLSCTGPSNDMNAVWPAITTSGAPVAGPGVSPGLLGSVVRAGVGRQVTYAGHPLYLFDSAPNQVNGEGFADPASPLPHGLWNLVRPNGNQLPWTQSLTTVTLGSHSYLAVYLITLAGWVRFPVYTRAAACTGACERAWPDILNQGFPGTSGGARAGLVGFRFTSLGTQLTYRGRPLYYYSQTALSLTTLLAAGNGNGVGGFTLVSP
jgi:predicted lipoprotein with Yx(FWY)xxD motif